MPPASGIREIQAQIPAREGGEHQLPSSQQPGLPELSRLNFPRDFLKAFGFVPKKRNKAQYRNLQFFFFFLPAQKSCSPASGEASLLKLCAGSRQRGEQLRGFARPLPNFRAPQNLPQTPPKSQPPPALCRHRSLPTRTAGCSSQRGAAWLNYPQNNPSLTPQHRATLPAPFPKPQVPGASPEGAAAPRGWAPSCGPEVGVTARGGQGEAPPGCPGVYFYLLGTRCPVHDRAPPPAALRVPKRRPDGAGSGRACAGAPGSGSGELGKEPFFYWDGLVPSWACRLVAGGLGKGVRVKPGMGRGSGDGRWGRA